MSYPEYASNSDSEPTLTRDDIFRIEAARGATEITKEFKTSNYRVIFNSAFETILAKLEGTS